MRNSTEILLTAMVVIACAAAKPAMPETKVADVALTPVVTAENPVKPVEMIAGVDTGKWAAPDSAANVKNPVTSSPESIAAGLAVYSKNCRSCHGKAGDGKGVGAEDCSTPPTDFLAEQFKKQSDGAIFWKINQGRNDMKPYKGELDKDEIWNVINYMRTLKPAE